MTFKVWDKVKFTEKCWYWSDKYCTIGNDYEVVKCNNKGEKKIRIIADNGGRFRVNPVYFELVQEDKLPHHSTRTR